MSPIEYVITKVNTLSIALKLARKALGLREFRKRLFQKDIENILKEMGKELDETEYSKTGSHFLTVKQKGTNHDKH